MAFLHSVLNDVYEKQPYKVGKESHLKSVVDALNEKLCSGHDGFKSAIVKVADGVREYNREVRESNNHVKSKITDFDREIKRLKTTVSKILETHSVSGTPDAKKIGLAEELVDKKALECRQYAEHFTSALDTHKTDEKTKVALNDLNDKLRDKIEYVRSTVQYEAERLEKVRRQEREDTAERTKKVVEVMKKCGEEISSHITTEVTDLVRKLKKLVEDILKELQKLRESLVQFVHKLGKWIDAADGAIKAADKNVDDILKNVDESYGSIFPMKIGAAADQVQRDIDQLYNAANFAKSEVGRLVTDAKKKVDHLEKGLKEDLNGMKMAINAKVTEIQTEIGKLHHVVEQGREGTGTKTVVAVMQYIQRKVAGITGRSGLKGIVDGVHEYAKTFANGMFENKVKEWLNHIFDKAPVKNLLAAYVSGNSAHLQSTYTSGAQDGLYKMLNDKVASVISNEVKKKFFSGGFPFATVVEASNPNSIEHNVKAVKQACEQFAEGLGRAMMHLKINVHMIVKAIGEEKDLYGSNTGKHDKTNLESAVNLILPALVGAAKQVGETVALFAGDNASKMQRYVEQTLADAKQLDSNLEKALGLSAGGIGPPGSSGTNYADKVDTAINEVTRTVTAQLPPDNDGGVQLTNFTYSFARPNGRGRQATDAKSRKEILDDAINDFKSKVVDDALSSIDSLKSQVEQQVGVVTTHVTELREAIKRIGYYAKGQLNDLKDKYFKKYDSASPKEAAESINKIHSDLSELQKKLESGPIKDAKNFTRIAGTADTLRNATVETLKKLVNKEIEAAQNIITIHFQKQYVDSIKRLLTSFAEKVEEELKPLPKDILHDLTLGHKAFMSKFAEHIITNPKSIVGIKDIENTPSQEKSPLSQAAIKLHGSVRRFFRDYQKNPDFSKDFRKIETSNDALQKMLAELITSKHFNNEFNNNLQSLNNELRALHPSEFGASSTPMLQSLKEGLDALTKELSKAYLNTYEGLPYEEADKDKYAKAFITSFYTIHDSLTEVKEKCNSEDQWKDKKCCEIQGRIKNPLGKFMKRCGFKIGHDENSKDSELQYPSDLNGQQILQKLLAKSFDDTEQIKHIKECLPDKTKTQIENTFNITHLLECLLHHVDTFNEVSHLALRTKPRSPVMFTKCLLGVRVSRIIAYGHLCVT
ncbi:hypothetical protein, conserved [Babesia ovata]|uniref:Extracellular matrix-binding ebh n=1 Tax=Babesia ovata TaxID=189622 RepID=A0A2H6KKK9_9APIC|nr:uncharacterized protein BOVATA_050240 [Babesia ovata]GBE63531.1 hypothetical protein, conserved [Babesia ovata]